MQAAIEACEECIHAAQECAAADIRHGEAMADCALLCLDTSDICAATLNAMARGSKHHADFARVCAHLCRACAEECGKHADHHDHCRRCKEACEACAAACEQHASEPAV